MIKPERLQVNAEPVTDWDERIWKLWNERVSDLFTGKEFCSLANYYPPRPYVDEYNRGSNREGFTYVLQPGRRVCEKSWISEAA